MTTNLRYWSKHPKTRELWSGGVPHPAGPPHSACPLPSMLARAARGTSPGVQDHGAAAVDPCYPNSTVAWPPPGDELPKNPRGQLKTAATELRPVSIHPP